MTQDCPAWTLIQNPSPIELRWQRKFAWPRFFFLPLTLRVPGNQTQCSGVGWHSSCARQTSRHLQPIGLPHRVGLVSPSWYWVSWLSRWVFKTGWAPSLGGGLFIVNGPYREDQGELCDTMSQPRLCHLWCITEDVRTTHSSVIYWGWVWTRVLILFYECSPLLNILAVFISFGFPNKRWLRIVEAVLDQFGGPGFYWLWIWEKLTSVLWASRSLSVAWKVEWLADPLFELSLF